MFRKSKTPIAKPLKQTSIVNFLPRPEQAALEAAPSPASTKKARPKDHSDPAPRSALKKKTPSSKEDPDPTPRPTPQKEKEAEDALALAHPSGAHKPPRQLPTQ